MEEISLETVLPKLQDVEHIQYLEPIMLECLIKAWQLPYIKTLDQFITVIKPTVNGLVDETIFDSW